MALFGVGLMTVITPGVVISNAQWYYEKPVQKTLVLPRISSINDNRIPENRIPLKNYCRMGDDYGHYHFSLAMYKRARAVSREPTWVSSYVPRPRPKPKQETWPEKVTKKVIEETEKVLRATKKAGQAVLDLTKRKVTGNGQRMILEPRTARMFIELERRWGEKLEVRWAFRDKKLNRKVGGKSRSYHLSKKAVDIVHGGWSREKMRRFVRLAYSIGFRGFGMGGRVIHLDTRSSFTSWNYGGNKYGLAYSMVR